MPALTNISVGSLCGTRGADGTRACPSFSKKSRKPRRMALVEGIAADVNAMLHRGKARAHVRECARSCRTEESHCLIKVKKRMAGGHSNGIQRSPPMTRSAATEQWLDGTGGRIFTRHW